MLDTGANQNFISEKFSSSLHGLEVHHDDAAHTVVLADGSSKAGIGYVKLPMTIHDHRNRGRENAILDISSIKFYILPNLSTDVVLGM